MKSILPILQGIGAGAFLVTRNVGNVNTAIDTIRADFVVWATAVQSYGVVPGETTAAVVANATEKLGGFYDGLIADLVDETFTNSQATTILMAIKALVPVVASGLNAVSTNDPNLQGDEIRPAIAHYLALLEAQSDFVIGNLTAALPAPARAAASAAGVCFDNAFNNARAIPPIRNGPGCEDTIIILSDSTTTVTTSITTATMTSLTTDLTTSDQTAMPTTAVTSANDTTTTGASTTSTVTLDPTTVFNTITFTRSAGPDNATITLTSTLPNNHSTTSVGRISYTTLYSTQTVVYNQCLYGVKDCGSRTTSTTKIAYATIPCSDSTGGYYNGSSSGQYGSSNRGGSPANDGGQYKNNHNNNGGKYQVNNDGGEYAASSPWSTGYAISTTLYGNIVRPTAYNAGNQGSNPSGYNNANLKPTGGYSPGVYTAGASTTFASVVAGTIAVAGLILVI